MAFATVSKMELFFVEPEVNVSGQYYWDMLLFQQMFAAIKHILDDNVVFHQTAHWPMVHATQFNYGSVKLFFLSPDL